MTRRPITSPTGKPMRLAAVRPNAGLEMAYRRKLRRLIEEMQNSTLYWITAAYRANPPLIAQDASPWAALKRAVDGLSNRWLKRFDVAAQELADHFATAAAERTDGALQAILKKGGISVAFQTTRTWEEIRQAIIAENVSLIKTIPQKHFADIEQKVMRSVQQGGDLQQLTNDLQTTFKVTRWRATLIASDQNRKATAVIERCRQQELGIERAVWRHSAGGNEPRPEHVKWSNANKQYDIAKGMWSDVDQAFVWPGTAINCKCFSQALVPGYDP